MATVYKAWDRNLAVFRAIKLLNAVLARSPPIRSRFLTEARAMARLTHPHVVSIQEVKDTGDRIFIVMDLIGGGNAWDRVTREGAWPENAAVKVIADIASAVQAAHVAGIIHRDIKPQNILLTPTGEARLTDFGIARFDEMSDRRAETRTGTVMGTWGYMPPEQRNDTSRVGPQSDIYALGATLWSLLRATTPTDLFMADREPTMLEGISPTLAKVLIQATRYRPEDRFESAGQLAEALQALVLDLRTEPIQLPPDALLPKDEPSGTLMALLDPVQATPELESDDGIPRVEAPSTSTLSHRSSPKGYVVTVAIGLALCWLFYWSYPQWFGANTSDAPAPVEEAPDIGPAESTSPSAPLGVPNPEPHGASRPPEASEPPPQPPVEAVPPRPVPQQPAAKPPDPAPAEPAPASDKPPQTTSVAPEVAPSPVEPPAPVANGTLVVTGEYSEFWVRNADGEEFEPGTLPVGTYTVFARFESVEETAELQTITIQEGAPVTLNCTETFQKCQ